MLYKYRQVMDEGRAATMLMHISEPFHHV